MRPRSLHLFISNLKPKNLANLIICGDFNIDPNIPSGSLQSTLSQLMLDFNLTQTVSEPTRIGPNSSSTIDLVLLSNHYSLSACDVLPPLDSSDHHSVRTKIKLSAKVKRSSPPTRKIWLYSRADLTLARSLLSALPQACPEDNINELWNQWTAHLLNTMEKSIPSRRVPIKSSTPWIDRNIQLAVSKRERLYRKFKRSNSQDWLYKYRSFRNKVIYMIRSAKKSFFESLASASKDPKKFWSTIKSVQPKRTLHGPLTNGHTTTSNDHGKACMLNEFFSCCFNPATSSNSIPEITTSDNLDAIDCTPGEVVKYLKNIKCHSAPGHDGITAWMLSTFAEEIGPSLSTIFNLSISSGRLPSEWKLSNIVPIPKGSARNDVRSYRPISLLPLTSKVLERHLHNILLDHLSSKGLLSDNQFGFRKGNSTVIPLLLATHQWHKALDKRQDVACVFFDYAKAFFFFFCL